MDYKVTEQLLHLIVAMSRDENKNEVRNIGQAIVAPIWWRVAAMYWQIITLNTPSHLHRSKSVGGYFSDIHVWCLKGPKTYRGTTTQDSHNECKYKLKLIGLILCVVVYTFYKSNSKEYNRQGDLKTELSQYEWCRWYCFWGPLLPVESNEKSNGLPRPGPGGSSAG